jgi:hypothetical protein
MITIEEIAWRDRYVDLDGDTPGDYLSRIMEDSELIKEVGANAYGFSPGVSIETPGGGMMQLDTASWNWLRPLIVELLDSRKNFNQADLNGAGGEG